MSDNTNNNQKNMVNIGGLWLNKDKDGNLYFSGYMNGAKLLVFKNNYKETDKHPDYVMYVTNPQPRPQSVSVDEFEQQADATGPTQPQQAPSDSSDIPF